jgi:hypothetical protein
VTSFSCAASLSLIVMRLVRGTGNTIAAAVSAHGPKMAVYTNASIDGRHLEHLYNGRVVVCAGLHQLKVLLAICSKCVTYSLHGGHDAC